MRRFLETSAVRVLLAVCVATTVSACSDAEKSIESSIAPEQTPSAVPASIVVRLDSSSVMLGGTVMARAMVLAANGTPIRGLRPNWSIELADSTADISTEGAIFGRNPGTATVVAGIGELKGSAELHVVPVPGDGDSTAIAKVRVTLDSIAIAVGAATVAHALVIDTAGRQVQTGVAWSVGGSDQVASMSPTGLASGIAPGSVRVTATAGGVTGSRPLVVAPSTQFAASLVVNGVTLPNPPATFTVTYPTVTGKRWYVGAGGSLQNALNSAQRGDEVVLQAGAVFTGNFLLPAKTGTAANGWIVVRSEKLSLIPAGVRVTPAVASLMPKVRTKNSMRAILAKPRASGWYFAGIEVTADPALTVQQYGLVELGTSGPTQAVLTDVPTDIVLDRMYIHGQSKTQLSRCVALNSARSAIINSYLHECHGKGFDSQAIAGWNGPGPFKIVNNTLAGAGENIMFGGADPTIPNLVPSDIEIRKNYIYTPAAWKGVWTKKNLFESKNSQRVLVEGNVFDGSWMDGQTGQAIELKSSNQSGKCSWCVTRDLTFRNNIIRNVGQPFNIAGRGNSNAIGEMAGKILIEQMWVERVNVSPYLGDGRFILVLGGAHDVTINRNTMSTTSVFATFTTFGSGVSNISMNGNVFTRGNYGLYGEGSAGGIGTAALKVVSGAKSFTNNVIIGAKQSAPYPTTTSWTSSLTSAFAFTSSGAVSTITTALAAICIP